MSTVKSGSFDPAPTNAELSYDAVSYPDCCPDQAPRPVSRIATPPPPTPTPAPAPAPCATGCVDAAFISQIEQLILKAADQPLSVSEVEELTVLGNRGIWTNRDEVSQWRSDLPLSEYKINEDPEPTIIRKKYGTDVVYQQELAVRYLRPPPPPSPGDIIIQHEPNTLAPPAPPLVIRQTAPRPCTPEPLVVREIPPTPPEPVGRKLITIAGKGLPPPPRKVIIERLPPVPAKPQGVISERWLPYEKQRRRVIYQPPQPDPVYCKPKNVIVQWDAPNVRVEQTVKYLGVVNANPTEYIKRYGETLKAVNDFPDIVRNIKHEEVLAADVRYTNALELEGDVEALKLVDLDREGLGEYRAVLDGRNSGLKSKSGASVSFASVGSLISGRQSQNTNYGFGSVASASAEEGAVEGTSFYRTNTPSQ